MEVTIRRTYRQREETVLRGCPARLARAVTASPVETEPLLQEPTMLTFGPHLDGFHDVADQMIHHLRARAEGQLARREALKASLTSIPAFEEYRARVREHYLRAIGGLPVPDGEPRPPLQAEITGTLERGTYRIEKLLYQSLPDFYVTASVYVPGDLAAPAPAVLFVCGHSELAKAYPVYQQVCGDLASQGFVVLAMDPPGQGERFQYWEPETGRRIIGGCTTEHTYAGLQFMLQGASPSRHFTWDAIRAVDYLCSRPEVDGRRIGVTGNSGGGTQTCLLMLAEPRLAAAVPCTFVMTLESYLKTGQAQDSEQLVAGCFLHGPDHDDFITAMAPKPVLVGAVAYDFFPLEGSLEAVERARRVYRLYGAEDRVKIAISPARHQYTPGLREAAVNWFLRHLAGLEPDFRPGDPETLPAEALNVTPTGQVLDAFPGSKTLFHLNRERMLSHPPSPPAEPEALRREVAAALGIEDYLSRVEGSGFGVQEAAVVSSQWSVVSPDHQPSTLNHQPPPHPQTHTPTHGRVIHESVIEGYPVEKIFFFSEPDVCVAGVMVHPRGSAPATRTDLLLLENGTASILAERARIEALLRRGHRVFVFDPRGVGAVESRPFSGAHPHDREWRLGCDAMMAGTSTLGLRVWDVLRAFDYLAGCREDVDRGAIALHGVDSGAAWAWFAAALQPGFCALTVENMLYSYLHLAGAHFYDSRRYTFRNLAPGLLARFDLGDLLPLLAPRPVRIVSPRDANGEPLDPAVYYQRVVAERERRLPRGWQPVVG